ncbi:hypothetical protein IF1G_05876 [Cordyceps javanica]|uniref:Uncharacterized protein n=1 Tax=Cordyceps javanica TaxID=43265 RepID=A0A545UZP0_9HYPO|nr:hypothetical protein IF1G_05876 [Cordyceps javanica]TQW05890.1 hypothetical protein IF2G_07012 [Cordyceps javanica]
MHRWRRLPHLNSYLGASSRRVFSTGRTVESVDVRCGSSGHVTVDLHNFSNLGPDEPIIVNFPSLPANTVASPIKLPTFLHGLPVATIHYRWDGLSPERFSVLPNNDKLAYAPWPTPVHDAAFAFSWLSAAFSPVKCARRSVYVYGSFLGASLASSLALTESHPHARFSVRGFMAYNGIYNWTMFLPDHRVNRSTTRGGRTITRQQPQEGSHLHFLQEHMPSLFGRPSNLFDAFASPSLLFHSPGLLVPRSFTMTIADAAAMDSMIAKDTSVTIKPKTPRKSRLVFPPRKSTLKLPEALLMHESSPTLLTALGKPPKRKLKGSGNSFQAQAAELAELMRHSINVVELGERKKWDDDMHEIIDKASSRVKTLDVGEGVADYELGATGETPALAWLQCRGFMRRF